LKVGVKDIPPVVNKALEIASVTLYREIHNIGGNVLGWA
jgi:hypothetical protein